MTDSSMPLPEPTPLSEPHWEGCRRGELRVQRCCDCGGYVFIPQPSCTHCLGTDLEWVRSSGRGKVYSFTEVHRPQQPAFATPYVVAVIELEEGWYMLSNLVEYSAAQLVVGQPVTVTFQRMSDTITLPLFRPVRD